MRKYSKGFLEKMYRTMVRIRLCEESFVEPILKGEVKCPVHLYSGQEAIATGVCTALKQSDYVFGTHRSHGHYLAKGGDMRELVAEIYCKETGCSRGRGGSMHICAPDLGMVGSAPIVAGTIPLALGAALASKIRKDGKVAVSFFGDGAACEGAHMPIRECRPGNTLFEIGQPFYINSYRVDGNDILKVHEVARKAVELCRENRGPIFIEFMTYRLRGHVGPDDHIQGTHTDIRPKEEIEKWRRKDPIKNFEKFLMKNKILGKKDLERINQETGEEVKEAHSYAKMSPHPSPKELGKYVFKE